VKKVALTHHDPLRDDDAIDRLVADVRTKLWQDSSSLDVFAAFEGQVVEVAASPAKGSARCVRELQAEMPIEPGLAKRSVLLAVQALCQCLCTSHGQRVGVADGMSIDHNRCSSVSRRALGVACSDTKPRGRAGSQIRSDHRFSPRLSKTNRKKGLAEKGHELG